MKMRSVLLKIHLWLALVGSNFLVVLGLTGSVVAFENDIDHWVHPSLYYVQVRGQRLPHSELIHAVERRFAPARVVSMHMFRQPYLTVVAQLSDRSTVFLDPYTVRILGRTAGPSVTEKLIDYIHQIHTHLVPKPTSARTAARIGGVTVQIAGFILCLLVPIGVVLWLRTKRASIVWRSSWFRVCFDAHHAIGIYAALFLLAAAFTGVMVEQNGAIFRLTHSHPLRFPDRLQSGPAEGAAITVDRAEDIARAVIPDTTVTDVEVPLTRAGVFVVVLRVPEETSEAAHSYVVIDQYSGRVLHALNFLTDSPGYRVIRFNRSIHTGDIWGTLGHVIVSVSSFLLVVMVVTGLVIWLKKLAG